MYEKFEDKNTENTRIEMCTHAHYSLKRCNFPLYFLQLMFKISYTLRYSSYT